MQFCSGSAIITNRHYKNSVICASENGCGALTMENVTYSDFMKIMKNAIMLRMLTRATFAHARNSAGSTFSSLVSVSGPFLQNTLESLTRQLLIDSMIFRACTNKLLVLASCRFMNFERFLKNRTCLGKCLGASPQQHFCSASAIAAFEMLLWLMTFYETLTPAASCCCDFL